MVALHKLFINIHGSSSDANENLRASLSIVIWLSLFVEMASCSSVHPIDCKCEFCEAYFDKASIISVYDTVFLIKFMYCNLI